MGTYSGTMRQLKIFAVLSCLALGIAPAMAQPISKSGRETTLEAAKLAIENNNWIKAIELYSEIYDEEKDLDLAYRIAQCYMAINDYAKAERFLGRIANKKSTKKSPNPYLPNVRYEYARVLKINEKYSEAVTEYKTFIAEGEDTDLINKAKIDIEGINLARSKDGVIGFTITSLGDKVNGKKSEYSPVLINGNTLYFTALRGENPIEHEFDKPGDDVYAKVYMSTRDDKGWTEAVVIGSEDNIYREGYAIGNIAMTNDGRKLFFTRNTSNGNEPGEGKLYVSEGSGADWGAAQEITGVNKEARVFAPAPGELFGKQVIFFASDMEGGRGGKDIYYATLEGDNYTNPVNLGPTINTPGNETTPYYLDGKLYFSSDFHPNYGGYDVFLSEWNGSAWSKPSNLGKPVNSSVDDLFFSIDASGETGILASNRVGTKSAYGKTCCLDLYLVQKQKVIIELAATTLTAKKALKGATVQLVEMLNNQPGVTDSNTKEEDNNFSFTLKPETAYMLIANKPGYRGDTLRFNTTGIKESTKIAKTLNLSPQDEVEIISTSEPIRLNNIYYDYNDDKILPDAEEDLGVLLDLMNQYSDMVIELSSHTDSRGNNAYNKDLSQRRANNAKKWLVEKGIKTERITPVGYGEEKILNKCTNGVECTDEEHRFNRRTEFKILSGPTTITIKKTVLKRKGGELPKDNQKNRTGGKQSVNPVKTLGDQQPSPKKAELTFDQKVVDLGTVKKGEKPGTSFSFKNTGTENVEIDFVSHCDCTEVSWPEGKIIKPGETGTIKAVYLSGHDEKDLGDVEKTIDLILKNKHPEVPDAPIVLTLKYKAKVVK